MMLGTEHEIRCSGEIVHAAIKVHRALGPGLFERVYAMCLAAELQDRGLQVCTELELPIVYRGRQLTGAYRIDMLVDRQVVVEVKTVRFFAPIHAARLLTYLRLSGFRVGLLLNFNTVLMKDGVLRRFNFGTRGHAGQAITTPCLLPSVTPCRSGCGRGFGTGASGQAGSTAPQRNAAPTAPRSGPTTGIHA